MRPIWGAPARLQTLALPGKLGWAQAASGWLPRPSVRERERKREESLEPGQFGCNFQLLFAGWRCCRPVCKARTRCALRGWG